MTLQEFIDALNGCDTITFTLTGRGEKTYSTIDLIEVEEAVERQIAVAPTPNEAADNLMCPVCEEFVGADCYYGMYKKNYCENCGQLIDWSDFE